jgi:hypothetical protein
MRNFIILDNVGGWEGVFFEYPGGGFLFWGGGGVNVFMGPMWQSLSRFSALFKLYRGEGKGLATGSNWGEYTGGR